MKLKELVKEALEQKYLGKRIKSQCFDNTFIVEHVSVEDGGVDPQWEILLKSERCRLMCEDAKAWQLANNRLGGILPPPELEEYWRAGYKESQYFTLCEQELPEIIEEN